MSWYQQWAPYKPVALRRAEAAQLAKKLAKKGEILVPVKIAGRAMATTFWGKAWCDNLERYSDYANRLPRGRTYARNGAILDLKIHSGQILALVSGSNLYKIKIGIEPLNARRWKNLRTDCAASIHSLLDLMRGKFSDEVMQRLTDAKTGLFPAPKEIKLACSCPDGAYLCKHLAAVMYGIGHRLDNSPELFFELRGLDHRELIEEALNGNRLDEALGTSSPTLLVSEDLGAMFGIDLATGSSAQSPDVPPSKSAKPGKRSSAVQPTKGVPTPAALSQPKPRTLRKVVKAAPTAPTASRTSVRTAASLAKALAKSKPKAKRRTATKAR